jgi:hypothetical protein
MLAGIGFFHYSGAVPPIHPKFSFLKDQSYVTLLPRHIQKNFTGTGPQPLDIAERQAAV